MRLIGEFPSERAAYSFHAFLLQEGIKNVYELSSEVKDKKKSFRVWIIDEEDQTRAKIFFEEYEKNPEDQRFFILKPLTSEEEIVDANLPKEGEIIASQEPALNLRKKRAPLTIFLVALCSFLFFMNHFQEKEVIEKFGELDLQVALTPIQRNLLFDYPHQAERMANFIEKYSIKSFKEVDKLSPLAQEEFQQIQTLPTWLGVGEYLEKRNSLHPDYLAKIDIFGKIKEGEYWRLVTPAFLHRDFLHLLFNMLWLLVLCRQIEEKLKNFKLLALIVTIAVLSNLAQYLISGPYFLGISGVVVGLASFIWLRQKIAPWEGYRLSKATALFLFIFVISMVGLEFLVFAFQFFTHSEMTDNIANTAHIVGGLSGLLLAKIPFFARKTS